MIDFDLLKSELQKDAYKDLSDADAAAAIAAGPAVIKTPKAARITYTTLGDAWPIEDVAVFVGKIEAAVAQANPLAAYVDKLLGGPGFDAANEKTAPVAAQLVGAGFCTQEQADGVLNDTAYPFGGLPVTADVSEARRRMAAEPSARAFYQAGVVRWAAFVAAFEAYEASGWDPALVPGDL